MRTESTKDDAQGYEDWFSTPFGRRADEVEKALLGELLSDFDRPRSMLEVGYGTGHFADWWTALGLQFVGLDADEDRLKFACVRKPGFPVVLGDGLHLPFRDNSFDVVAMITSMEFMNSPEDALIEAARVSRQGLLLGVLNSASLIALWRRLRTAKTYESAKFFSPWELRRLVHNTLQDTHLDIRMKTGLYPLKMLDSLEFLPFGAFIGMNVRFQKES